MHDDSIATAIARLNQAIIEDNPQLLTEVLSEFSLLRYGSLSKEVLADESKKHDFENMRHVFEAISQVRSPEMIYAILAAGFSVFDLGALLKSKKSHKAYIMLTNMIPSLTEKEIASLDAEDTPVCMYTRFIARIPVNVFRVHYDLLSVFRAINAIFPDVLGRTASLGYSNATFQHDKLELDLDLLTRLLAQTNSTAAMTNARCLENIKQDVNEFNKNVTYRLDSIRFKSYCFSAYLALVFCILFFGELLIYKYLRTLPDDEINRLWDKYYTVVKLCSLMLQATLFPGAFFMMEKKTEFDALRAIPKLKFEQNELAFDYQAAQQRLIKDIPSRFSYEFAAESKPASLLFWGQAFKPQAKDQPQAANKAKNRSIIKL